MPFRRTQPWKKLLCDRNDPIGSDLWRARNASFFILLFDCLADRWNAAEQDCLSNRFLLLGERIENFVPVDSSSPQTLGLGPSVGYWLWLTCRPVRPRRAFGSGGTTRTGGFIRISP